MYTIIMIVCIAIVLFIAAIFGFAVSKGYDYKHTVDPHPEDEEADAPDVWEHEDKKN